MSDRWERGHVLALAPDAAAAKAAATVARPAAWTGAACDGEAAWGECRGSGKSVYRVSVDLTGPAFRCSCPSRKFPCKHALGLLLLWSDGAVPGGRAADRPPWAAEWLAGRRARAEDPPVRATARAADPATAERRAARVDAGLDDLDRWLRDQVEQGLARTENAPYALFDDLARRLVDAQAGALAGQVRALAAVPRRPGWPGALLAEYALLRLLVHAHRRPDLPAPLRDTVRARIGFTVPREEVLAAGERVRDRWCVVGVRDTAQDRLATRRAWLRGRGGRSALVLSFAPPGRPLDASLAAGTEVDAELAFFPGAAPLRALVAERHGAAAPAVPDGVPIGAFLAEHAAALAADPWLDRWPAVLSGVRFARRDGGLAVVDAAGDVLPLRDTEPWRLLAVSGGAPVTLAGEWTPRGLRPLAAWHDDEAVVL